MYHLDHCGLLALCSCHDSAEHAVREPWQMIVDFDFRAHFHLVVNSPGSSPSPPGFDPRCNGECSGSLRIG